MVSSFILTSQLADDSRAFSYLDVNRLSRRRQKNVMPVHAYLPVGAALPRRPIVIGGPSDGFRYEFLTMIENAGPRRPRRSE
jgi:hypothetical protein